MDDNQTETVLNREALLEIKHAAQELVKLDDSIYRAQEQIDAHPGKQEYINTREHCIKHWKEKTEEHYKNMAEAFNNLTQ